MAITRPDHFRSSFNSDFQIGDMWFGGGIWYKPLDLPGGLSYWTFINVGGGSLPADSGMWSDLPNVLDLTSYADSASQEYKNAYNYGTAYHLNNWGSEVLGQDTWEWLLDYCNNYYSWLWGDVYSGLAIMRESNNRYSFLATYGLYEDGNGNQKIAATSSNEFTREQLSECGFCWYTNVSNYDGHEYTGTTEWDAVWLFCKNVGWTGTIETNTYEMTDYTNGWIIYGSLQNQSVPDTLIQGFTNNAFGGQFPKKTTTLNSVNSPYTGAGFVYKPETVIPGWTLVSGGPFTEATDASADSAETPAGGGGGGGSYDNSSDDIDFPDSDQFAVDALNSGLITVFNPTKQDIIDFASFLYSNSITDAVANQLKRLIADPLDYIVGLNIAHFTPVVSTTGVINFGGVSTGVSANIVSPQFQFIDCGTKDVNEETNSFQDYSMSKVKIFLPYCGTHQLDIQEVMGGRIHVQYVVDCLSGACVANVKIVRCRDHVYSDPDLNSILYSFTGNCFTQVPLTSRDFQSTISGLLGVAASAGTFGAGVATGNPAMMMAGSSGVINGAMGSTPNAQQVGNYSSNYGYMQNQKPYLILERPMASVPSMYEEYYGRPLYDYVMKIDKCEGYTEIDTGTLWTDKFDWITSEEEEMLKSMLDHGGIYIDHSSEYYNYDPEA